MGKPENRAVSHLMGEESVERGSAGDQLAAQVPGRSAVTATERDAGDILLLGFQRHFQRPHGGTMALVGVY